MRQVDFLDAEITEVDKADRRRGVVLAGGQPAGDRPRVNVIVAATFMAAVGRTRRFPGRRKLTA
jgi:hypothetical protein